MNELLLVADQLAVAIERLRRVRDLYLQQGTTASEICEAERFGNRADGIAYALSIVDEVLEGQLT